MKVTEFMDVVWASARLFTGIILASLFMSKSEILSALSTNSSIFDVAYMTAASFINWTWQ